MNNKFLIGALALAAPLLGETKILALSGSSREGSFNEKLIQEAAAIAREMGGKVTLVDLADFPMPFYDGDLEKSQGMPPHAKRLRDLMIASDAIVIASPEYNASIPAVLKNAIDWTSRSETGGPSRDAFKGKKFAIMSASPSQFGGARGLVHLRAILNNAGAEVLVREVTVPQAFSAFDSEGKLTSVSIKEALQLQVQELSPAKKPANEH